MPSSAHLLEPDDIKFPAGYYEKYVGLKNPELPEGAAAAQLASGYLKQLQEHPLDSEAREKLALVYAEGFKRLDLARDEIETLISQPGHAIRSVVRWVNLLADLQLRIGNDVSAYAEQANTRRAYLKFETKCHEPQRTVKLGVYEKDVGLKHPRPKGG